MVNARIDVGLKTNLENTKVMPNSFASQKKIVYNNTEIKEGHSYMHLGQKITSDNIIMNEINRSVLGKNNKIMKNGMPHYLKRKGFNQCVLPALTYGVET